jgi:DNA topoisomerase-1
VLAEKKASRGAPQALKDLGEHDGEPVRVMNGRYGPYIKYKKINATIPRGTDPESIDLETAMKLVAEKEAKGGKKPARKKAPAKKKKAAATKKKATAKKA